MAYTPQNWHQGSHTNLSASDIGGLRAMDSAIGLPDGVVGNGSNDDTEALQEALDKGGRVTLLGDGRSYKITDTLRIENDSTVLAAETYQPRINGGTFTSGRGAKITWQGATDAGPMVKIAYPATSTGMVLGCGLENITLDCNQKASVGLQFLSARKCYTQNIHIHEARSCSLDHGPISDSYDVSASRSTQFIKHWNFSAFNFSADGSGIQLRGTTNFGTGGENCYGIGFYGTYVRVNNGTAAIDIQDADDCFFYDTFIGPPGTAHAVELRGYDGVNYKSGARNCHFYGLYPGNGGIYSRTGTDGIHHARNNSIWGLSFEDGTEPEITIETGSTLVVYDTRTGGKLVIPKLTLQQAGSVTGATVTSFAGSPESNVTASPGSYCADTTNGEGYIKKTGSGNTGWKLITHA